MKNKGFTLVELLAVIVILAIIMIIAIPAVLYTLSNAQKSSFEKYILKSINLVEQKELSTELLNGTSSGSCVIYNIKTDLDLTNTGTFDGYILVTKNNNGTKYVITLWNDEYMLLPYDYTNKLNYKNESVDITNAIEKYNDSKKDEMTSTKLCSYGCTECSTPQKEVVLSGCKYSIGQTFNFSYIGGTQTFTPECDGKYKLEVWGAQGGTGSKYIGGKGGYSKGTKELTKNSPIYIVVGGNGSCSVNSSSKALGGYNGGGSARARTNYYSMCSGGGATHIGEVNATLAVTGISNLNTIYIVAGGGGGSGEYHNNGSNGGAGGGLSGLVPTNSCSDCGTRTGGSQTAGGTGRSGTATFGQGRGDESGPSCGGGGGLYGGAGDSYEWGGYGGSGYIGGVNDGETTAGINEGTGRATITYLG